MCTMTKVFILFGVILVLLQRETQALGVCESVTGDSDGPFWIEAAKCSKCVLTDGCGYCFSSMRCIEGGIDGPLDESPCPEWIMTENECPVVPDCEEHSDCSKCAAVDDCAWCASEGACVPIAATLEENCRGIVFELPCPDSFIAG